MAIEYVLQADNDLTSADLRAFYAAMLDGELGPDGTVYIPGMYVMARHVTADEVSPLTHLFGFEHRINATYRFRNLAESAEEDHNTVLMARSVLALAERFGGRGVLLFNGERAVMQWASGDVTFDRDWEDWSELEEAVPLVAGHALKPLAQPLL